MRVKLLLRPLPPPLVYAVAAASASAPVCPRVLASIGCVRGCKHACRCNVFIRRALSLVARVFGGFMQSWRPSMHIANGAPRARRVQTRQQRVNSLSAHSISVYKWSVINWTCERLATRATCRAKAHDNELILALARGGCTPSSLDWRHYKAPARSQTKVTLRNYPTTLNQLHSKIKSPQTRPQTPYTPASPYDTHTSGAARRDALASSPHAL